MKPAVALRVGYLFDTETLLALLSLLGLPPFLPCRGAAADTETLIRRGYVSQAEDGRATVDLELAFLLEALALSPEAVQWTSKKGECLTACVSRGVWILCRKTAMGKWEICPLREAAQAAVEIDGALRGMGPDACFTCRFSQQTPPPSSGARCVRMLRQAAARR